MFAFLMLLDTHEERSEFVRIFDKYYTDVYYTALSITNDLHMAEDVAQIAFERIARKFDMVISTDESKRRRYICTLTKNAAINMMKKKKDILSNDGIFTELVADPNNLLEDYIIDIENREETLMLLNDINQSYSEILYLKYYQELSNKEIGEMLSLSDNAVRVKLYRALESLRKIVGREKRGHE